MGGSLGGNRQPGFRPMGNLVPKVTSFHVITFAPLFFSLATGNQVAATI